MNDKRISPKPLRVSSRSAIRPFVAMDVLAAANQLEAQGRRVIHMEVGQPTAPTPHAVLAAARAGLSGRPIVYTEAMGTDQLRGRIATHYLDAYGIEVDPRRVAVTTGSSAGFTLAFLAAFNPGDRVAVASPGYPAYRNILRVLGLEVVEIELTPNTGPNITPQQLEEAHREAQLAGLLVASPANPTGSMLSPSELSDLMHASEELGIRFISDEIYHGLVYSGTAETALRFSNEAIVINSFSKYYCMAGWRVGWMVMPEDLSRPIERLAQNLYLSPPDLSQRAALGAFESIEELDAIKAGYAQSRSLLLDRLPTLGFGDLYPVDGAFYVYASVASLSGDSTDFAKQMLQQAGVAATPGLDFDLSRGAGTIRFSFSGTPTEVAEAIERMEAWLG
ncbi:MAG: aminotransferase class I/II-fold pyridoxal phosphate-dependent enzyme [Alphaproteobacteria bacterium]